MNYQELARRLDALEKRVSDQGKDIDKLKTESGISKKTPKKKVTTKK